MSLATSRCRVGERDRHRRRAGWLTRALAALCAAAMLMLAGCAAPAGVARSPKDPLEPMNRAVYEFNDVVDRAVLKPLARWYVDYLNEGVRITLGNMFANLGDLWTAANQLLQGKPLFALGDLSRFLINSTFGFAGAADVASELGLERHREDFGQTLGRWGVPAGPYLVLPFLGPSSVRDAAALPLDWQGGPLGYLDNIRLRNSLYGARLVDARAGLLASEKVLDGAALDRYGFLRDGYLQRRRSLVHDGDPPDEEPPPPVDEQGARDAAGAGRPE